MLFRNLAASRGTEVHLSNITVNTVQIWARAPFGFLALRESAVSVRVSNRKEGKEENSRTVNTVFSFIPT